jgi:hypothetical protein
MIEKLKKGVGGLKAGFKIQLTPKGGFETAPESSPPSGRLTLLRLTQEENLEVTGDLYLN